MAPFSKREGDLAEDSVMSLATSGIMTGRFAL